MIILNKNFNKKYTKKYKTMVAIVNEMKDEFDNLTVEELKIMVREIEILWEDIPMVDYISIIVPLYCIQQLKKIIRIKERKQ